MKRDLGCGSYYFQWANESSTNSSDITKVAQSRLSDLCRQSLGFCAWSAGDESW